MATLRQRKDGRYFIDLRDTTGVRSRHMIRVNGQPCRDAVMARAYFDHWLKFNHPEAREHVGTGKSSPRIADILDYYKDVYLVASNAAPATCAAALTHCTAFIDWCKTQHIGRVQQLNGEVLTRWLAHLQGGPTPKGSRTSNNYLTTVRAALNVAVDAELIDRNPVKRWAISKVDAIEKHPLSVAELRAVMDIFHDRPIVIWMCLTGQRPSDARTLKFGDVDVESQTVQRQSVKVRALRKFEICAEAANLVKRESVRRHHPEDVVFLSSLGKAYTSDGLFNLFKDRLRQAEFTRPVTPKTLRDSFATIMANEVGIPLPQLQILMGHTRIETTMQYVRARGAREWLSTFQNSVIPKNFKKMGTTGHQPNKAR